MQLTARLLGDTRKSPEQEGSRLAYSRSTLNTHFIVFCVEVCPSPMSNVIQKCHIAKNCPKILHKNSRWRPFPDQQRRQDNRAASERNRPKMFELSALIWRSLLLSTPQTVHIIPSHKEKVSGWWSRAIKASTNSDVYKDSVVVVPL